MSAVDFRLNMHLVFPEVYNQQDLDTIFTERATEVRRGVMGSPRGLKSGEPVSYTGYHVLLLSGAYELLFEHTSEASGLPLNKCAQRYFGCDFYGPVLLVRRICEQFVSITHASFVSGDIQALRIESPRAFRDFKQARDLDETSVLFIKVH